MNFSLNPVRTALRLARFVWRTPLRVLRRRRNRQHELRTAEYSVINDVCHDYGVMLYYITLDQQRQQLQTMGFAPDAQAFDLRGEPITGRSEDSSMMLIARKPLRA
jgi:hypothetical protein